MTFFYALFGESRPKVSKTHFSLRSEAILVYMVSGVTHPHVLRREGEKYRLYLQTLAKDLGVEANVIFATASRASRFG